MTVEFHLYRGLPASGKTTAARAWVADDQAHRARVNRDDLRAMLHDGVFLGHDTEEKVRAARDTLIGTLLKAGVSVACDDTNLPQREARALARAARAHGAHVVVHDMTNISLEECIHRDAARPRSVGADVIVGMHERYLAGKARPLPFPQDEQTEAGDLYVPRARTPRAIMVDLDGTLCLHNGRSPYDESRVGEDRVNDAVRATVLAAYNAGSSIVYCSGRSDGCRTATKQWLVQHDLPEGLLFMRRSGDMRKDAIVKRELFDAHIRDHYNVLFVLDDRRQVVDMWRELGLTVFQVADGSF